MSEMNDGGPLQPTYQQLVADGREDSKGKVRVIASVPTGGLSIRDYFAAEALAAMTAGDHVDGEGDPGRHAALAYKYADAMLKARESK